MDALVVARARRVMRALAALLLAAAAGLAAAEDAQPAPEGLAGTLRKARASGHVTIGYRESSIPFSYLSQRGEPIGYSIDLCKLVVDAMSEAVGQELEIRWQPVTSATRIAAVTSGEVDLECGSTTDNAERRRQVAFSPTIFVSGTKLLVKKGSPIRDFKDLTGKKVAVTRGTTNEQTLQALSQKFKLDLNLLVQRDHAESFAQVVNGAADAFATDDVLLYGLIAQNKDKLRGEYQVVGDFLSYDPYGIMYRRNDPQLAKVVNDTFQFLAQDGEIERQYKRWFLRKLPLSSTSIDLPMSPQLETILQTMAVKAE